MSKYAYHPPNRPAPADSLVSGRVATLNPISKCLQVALDELLTEDQSIDEDDSIGLNGTESGQYISSKKRKQSIDVDDSDGQLAMKQSSDEHNIRHDTSDIHNKNIRIDETISKSILDSYSNAVATTKFDDQEKQVFPGSYASLPHDDTNSTSTNTSYQQAPAAIIQGEIDHYNRVGSNWRIVVKNATLKSRSVTKIGNGLDGLRYRSRTVLDWDDDKVDGASSSCKKKRSLDGSSAKRKDSATKDDYIHRFEGTVQILAYDDKC